MDIGAVIGGIESRLKSIAGLRVYPWASAKPSPPAALISLPDRIVPRGASRGLDRIEGLTVIVVAGRPTDRGTPSTLSPFISSSGPKSITAVVESGTYAAFDVAEVKQITINEVEIAGVAFLAGLIEFTITGPGGTQP